MAISYDITKGLFGDVFDLQTTPEEQRAKYLQNRDATAINLAQLQPGRTAVAAGGMLAQDLGQDITALGGGIRRNFLGIQTTQEQEQEITKKLQAQAAQIAKSQGLEAAVTFLQQGYADAGMSQKAMQAAQLAEQVKQKNIFFRSDVEKNLAAAAKSNREGRTPLADRLVALDTKKATTGLTPAEEAEKEALERVVKLQSPKETKFDFGAAFGKEESKQQAQVQTDAYKALGGVAVAGARTLRDIGEVESIIDDTFKGGAANLQIGASKLAAAAGIQIPKTASNSEIVQALFGKLVIPLVKQFPGALAVKELEALQKTQPQLLNEPETIKRLIALAKQDILASREVFDRASKYKKENKDSLKGFDFDAETVSVYDLISEASRLTPEKAAELAKTEEGKERLRQLRKFMPKG